MAITPLPPAPERTDPANFSSKADAFVGALPTFGTEANALAIEVEEYKETAAEAATLAGLSSDSSLASANFAGIWATLTGALTVPASTYHNLQYWQLTTDLADVTTAEPGVSASWLLIQSGDLFLQTDTISSLRALSLIPIDGQTITVLGYYANGDGGGGQFYWDATSTEADNGGTIIKVTSITTGRWIRIYQTLNASFFGLVADDATDDSNAIIAAGAVAEAKDIPLILSTDGIFIDSDINLPNVSVVVEAPYRIGSSGSLTFKNLTDKYRGTTDGFSALNSNESRFSFVRERMAAAAKGKGRGTLAIIGDSISAGTGSTDPDNAYIGILREQLNNIQTGGYGFEITTNFDESGAAGGISTTGSLGTRGPVQTSLILDVGETLIFNGNYQYIDFFYHQATGAGSVEIERDGVLVRTVDFSGTETEDVTSFTGSKTDEKDVYSVWTITAITAQVEITALLRLKYSEAGLGNVQIARMQNAGTSTSDYITSSVLDSILTIGSFYNSTSTYLIAVGTNDIYAPSKRVLPSVYKTNLQTMVTSLSVSDNDVVLWVPPQADEDTWPATLAPYSEYRNVVYEVGKEFNVPVVDLFDLDLDGRNFYDDGIHPDDAGHQAIALLLKDKLGIEVGLRPQGYDKDRRNIEYNDDWGDFSGIPAKAHKVGNVIHLSGLADPNTSTSLMIGTLPSGFRPEGREVFTTALINSGVIDVQIATNGNITLGSLPSSWAALDGVTFVIDQNL